MCATRKDGKENQRRIQAVELGALISIIDPLTRLENWLLHGPVASGRDILPNELRPSRVQPYGSANYRGERPPRTI